jgi:hypothetical protein
MDLDAVGGVGASSGGGEVRLCSLGEETRKKEKTVCPHKLGKLLARSFRAFTSRSSIPCLGELLALELPGEAKAPKAAPNRAIV